MRTFNKKKGMHSKSTLSAIGEAQNYIRQ